MILKELNLMLPVLSSEPLLRKFIYQELWLKS